MRDLSRISDTPEIQMTLFPTGCESEKFSPHIHPDEARRVVLPCAGRGRLHVVTCRDEGLAQDLAEVGGLDMMDVKIHISRSRIPQFIPVVPADLFKRPASEIPSKTVGVVLNDILTKRLSLKCGRLQLAHGSTIDPDVLQNKVFREKRVILFSTGPDILIETLWWERHQNDLFRTIAGMGFAAVTGMNFSVINGECPFAHALNIKKSLRYCGDLDALGVWTIPHVYAINDHQRKRWGKWLLANPRVQTVTVNAQLQRNQPLGMYEVIKTVRHLLENTSVRIIIHGPGKGALACLKEEFESRVHFAAGGPLKKAVIRKDKTLKQHINAFRKDLRPVRTLTIKSIKAPK
jgi:hypothetical protein